MVHANKKQFTHYLFLTLSLYFLFQTTYGSDLQNSSTSHEYAPNSDFLQKNDSIDDVAIDIAAKKQKAIEDEIEDLELIDQSELYFIDNQDTKETYAGTEDDQGVTTELDVQEPLEEFLDDSESNSTNHTTNKLNAPEGEKEDFQPVDSSNQLLKDDEQPELTKEEYEATTDQGTDGESDSQEQLTYPKSIDFAARNAIHEEKRIIKNIIVSGNKIITKDSIVHRLPLKIGDIFNSNYTSTMIKNLYKSGYFHQVKIYVEPVDEQDLNLHVVVVEKPRLQEIIFTGNKAISTKEFKDDLKVATLPTLVQEELVALTSKIKKMYQKKNYHHVEIESKIIPLEDDTVSAEFTINEGKKSYLTRISFKGNKHVSSKKLKRIILSKEDWILGMIDRSGSYNPEMLEGDKYMIEDSYKSNGFINAKVITVDAILHPKTGNYDLTYHIFEGDRYVVKSVDAVGNDILSEEQLKRVIPIIPGQYYSQERIRTALDNLKMIWGEYGYIFADIDPGIDINEEDKTVAISFRADLKEQVKLNRLTITGNKKTKDNVLRRNILLDEGELITNRKMEASKSRVSLLNYFDPKNGVNWKTTKIDDTHADLDLMLNEVQTGHFNFNLGYGGSPSNRQSPTTGVNFNCNLGDRNLLGSGIATSASAEISKRYRALNINLIDPWIADKPIRGALNAYVKKSEYDSIEIAQNPPFERSVGGSASLGYVTGKLNGILMEGVVSFEKINYDARIIAAQNLGKQKSLAQIILDQNFQAGSQVSLVFNLSQDKRDGIVFTTRGHQWAWVNQFSFPGQTWATEKQEAECPDPQFRFSRFQYYRSELDVTWYTPLINEYDLVLCVHGNAGFIHKFKDKQVPWKAVYHVGGPTTVRGYLYGQVGPMWSETSLGALKAFNVNVELIMPLSSNLNTRGVVFYDGGAGWDTPYYGTIVAENPLFAREIQNNNFFYRHSVGIGMRIKSPSPLQVDFGIKLNPSKKYRKHLTELHLNVEHSF